MSITTQISFLDAQNQAKPAFDSIHRQPKIALHPSITFYIFAEMIQLGKGNRSVSNVVRVGKISRQYQTDIEGSFERVHAGALEKACEIACSQLYKLQDQTKPFKRVFVSQFEDTQQAKQDKESLDYFPIKVKKDKQQSRLSTTLLEQSTIY